MLGASVILMEAGEERMESGKMGTSKTQGRIVAWSPATI
jgi:hypothetical protein